MLTNKFNLSKIQKWWLFFNFRYTCTTNIEGVYFLRNSLLADLIDNEITKTPAITLLH